MDNYDQTEQFFLEFSWTLLLKLLFILLFCLFFSFQVLILMIFLFFLTKYFLTVYKNSNSFIRMESKLDQYLPYIKLTQSERKSRINNAKQTKNAQQNPQGKHVFPNINFIELQVLDEKEKPINLTTYRYPAQSKPKAIFIMFHGFNSHIGHGAHLAHFFSKQGIQTVGFDHRGFGQSQGNPAYVKDLDTHLGDCLQFVRKVMKLYPELPKFVLGISMGGLTAYHLSLRHPDFFKGAILMAPALKNNVNNFLVGLSAFMKKILPQDTRLIKPLKGNSNSSLSIVEELSNDPYVYKGRCSLSTISFLTKTMDMSPSTFQNYTCPFLVIQGGLDRVVNPMAAFELFKTSPLPQKDKDIIFYENMWHAMWHEPQIFQIIEKVKNWIHKRMII